MSDAQTRHYTPWIVRRCERCGATIRVRPGSTSTLCTGCQEFAAEEAIEMLGTHLGQIGLRDDRLIEMDRAALRAAMELTARLRRHAR